MDYIYFCDQDWSVSCPNIRPMSPLSQRRGTAITSSSPSSTACPRGYPSTLPQKLVFLSFYPSPLPSLTKSSLFPSTHAHWLTDVSLLFSLSLRGHVPSLCLSHRPNGRCGSTHSERGKSKFGKCPRGIARGRPDDVWECASCKHPSHAISLFGSCPLFISSHLLHAECVTSEESRSVQPLMLIFVRLRR